MYNIIFSLIEQSESHVVIRLLGFLLLFFLGSLLSGASSGASSCGGGGSWSSCSNSRSHVAEEILDVHSLKSLGEEAGPVWLNVDLGSLEKSQDLLTLNKNVELNEKKAKRKWMRNASGRTFQRYFRIPN